MKNIFEILSSEGINIPEDKQEAIKKTVAENYKTVNEFNSKTEKTATEISEYKKQIETLTSDIQKLQGNSEELEALKKTVADYKTADENRKKAEEAERANTALLNRYALLKGEKKYKNTFTENGLFEEFKTALSKTENAGKSDTEIYTALIKDRETELFESPNKITINRAGNRATDNEYLANFYKNNPHFKN